MVFARGGLGGGGACRQLHRRTLVSVAGAESRRDDVAGPQACRYGVCVGGQLRCERMLANAGCAWMMLRAVG